MKQCQTKLQNKQNKLIRSDKIATFCWTATWQYDILNTESLNLCTIYKVLYLSPNLDILVFSKRFLCISSSTPCPVLQRTVVILIVGIWNLMYYVCTYLLVYCICFLIKPGKILPLSNPPSPQPCSSALVLPQTATQTQSICILFVVLQIIFPTVKLIEVGHHFFPRCFQWVIISHDVYKYFLSQPIRYHLLPKAKVARKCFLSLSVLLVGEYLENHWAETFTKLVFHMGSTQPCLGQIVAN